MTKSYRVLDYFFQQEEVNKRNSVTPSQLKEQYAQHQRAEEARKNNEHVAAMEEELRRYRRDQLGQRQTLERQLLIEVSFGCVILDVVFCNLAS